MTAVQLELMSRDWAPDPGVAQRRASDPNASVWVGASAGTGKTKVLTDRVLRLLLAGTTPERILCLTFTKAAAAEMANRLQGTLAGWATIPDGDLQLALHDLTGSRPTTKQQQAARRLFARVADTPGGMRILTIHAFCQSVLRRFPLEAGVPPHFDLAEEFAAAEMLREAQADTIRQARLAPDSTLGRALACVTARVNEAEFSELIQTVTTERGRLARLFEEHGGLDRTIAAVYGELGVEPEEDEAAIISAACCDGACDSPNLRLACELLADGSDSDKQRAQTVTRWLEAREGRVHGWAAYLGAFLKKTDGDIFSRLATQKVAKALPALEAEAERLRRVTERIKAARMASGTAALLTVGWAIAQRYEARKNSRALLDYDDLIHRTAALLEQDGAAPWVLFKLDGGIDHILVDEAQDTNPDQWQIVAKLAEEFFAGESSGDPGRTIFAVGDEKQSIFSFQRADPVEFARMRAHFAAQARAVGDACWQDVGLNISFRSTPAVLAAVDAVFAREEARDGVGTGAIRHDPTRRNQAGLVELWPAILPEAEAPREPWALPIEPERLAKPEARLANAIADRIARWLGDGEILESKNRAIVPGDILVLVRRRTAFLDQLVRCLKQRGVPVAGVDRMVLTEQLAVMDLLAIGDFLLLPEDDLTLATVLKTPIIGLSEEQLFSLAYRREGSLWAALVTSAEKDPAFAPARRYLGDLLARADYVPPYELFAQVLNRPCPGDRRSARRAIAGRLGSEALDPLEELLTAALAFERSHPPSLQGFLAWLRAGQAEIKREAEQEGESRVRLMTVHGAKGLQAPIVILPDTMGVPEQTARLLWPEGKRRVPLWAPRSADHTPAFRKGCQAAASKQDQEYRRLLYVALTRAEDRLYVCGYGTTKPARPDCWYHLVSDGLKAHSETDRLPHGDPAVPGELLRLSNPQCGAPEQDRKRARDDEVADGLPGFALALPKPEEQPPRPLTPSRPEGTEPPFRSPLGSDDGLRFKRGSLIHRLLQSVPELPAEAREAACRRFLSRATHGLSPEQQDEIARETLGVLSHPEFAPIFGPGSRAEVPVVGLIEGRALSGQIDRVLVTETSVLVVDYKTNRPPPEEAAAIPPVYLRQMAAYRAALRLIYPGRTVRCALLWTDGPTLMAVPDSLMDTTGLHGMPPPSA